ncbi:Clavaminate synthase-like protein [Thozetella sp. PMI_491]|nr:Clavaminate synthase-like protein [Thozetella sp. PMI_491]
MAPSIDVLTPVREYGATGPSSTSFPTLTAADIVKREDRKYTRDWPTTLDSALVWSGQDFQDESEYVYKLSADEISEITSALRHFQGLKLGLGEVKMATFPLPNLKSKLSGLRSALFEGRGFLILRGLDSQSFSVEENAILSLGISSYVNECRAAQTQAGDMIKHVLNADWVGVAEAERPFSYTNKSMHFHTDFACSVLVMYAVNVSAEGGNHKFASAWKIYNELVDSRPDVIELLARPDWVAETSNPRLAYHKRPLLHREGGKIMINFERRALLGTSAVPRLSGLPELTEAQVEALDLLQTLAEKHQLSTTIRRGDMCFVNNLCLLHSRDSYRDDESSKRHLIRLWLQRGDGEEGWDVPETLQFVMESRMGGMKTDEDQNWTLDLTAEKVLAVLREECN